MKKILKPRQMGKTVDLIHMSADKDNWPTYIVCASRDEADRVAAQARKIGLDIPFPITFTELLRGKFARGGRIKGFLIDNADLLLQGLGEMVPIVAITMSIGGDQ